MSDHKSEAPSKKKKQDSRKKGEVPNSKDLTQAVLVVAVLGYLMVMAVPITARLAALISASASWPLMPLETAVPVALHTAGAAVLHILGPVVALVFVLGLLADGLQVGPLVAWKKLLPSMQRLNVVQNVKNVFSKKNAIEFLKSLVKLIFLSALAALVLRDSLADLLLLPEGDVGSVAQALGAMLTILLWNMVAAYGVIGVIDLFWQRSQFTEGIKMTKHEAKRERKDSDGNPLIKEKRRDLRYEAAETPRTPQAGTPAQPFHGMSDDAYNAQHR